MVLSASGITLNYTRLPRRQEGNSAPSLLLLHGWGGTQKSLMPLATMLSFYADCYIPDLPGFGKSSKPPDSWGIYEYADCLKEFIHLAGIDEPVQLVGHSFGGAIGLILAAHYPELIEKLVVCAPSWHRAKKYADETPKKPLQQALSKGLRHFPYLRKTLYRTFFSESDMLRKPELEANFKKIVSQDLTDVVTQIQQHTLIVWGGQDTYTPVSDGALLKHLIPHALLTVFPDATHALPVTQSHLVFPSIHTFLTTKVTD